MRKARVAVFSVSLDGFKAGPRQDVNNPLGVRGFELHPCFQGTEAFSKMHGHSGGTQGIDNHFASKSFANLGVWILGRNMFGPVRGAWRGDSWKGWWGDNPPYHTPVFVLTHYGRPPLEMEGGTTFHFVTDGIESAHGKAIAAANEKDVGIGGGVSTIRQYLLGGQIDELHLALSPVLLGEDASLLAGINLCLLGYNVVKSVAGENATHILIEGY